MIAVLRALVVLICILTMAGCTSMRIVSAGPPTASASLAGGSHRIVNGDRVRVTLTSGEVKNLTVTRYGAQGIEGVEAGNEVAYPAEAISRIEKREVNAKKTFFLVLGVVAVISTLAQAASATSRMVNVP